MIFNRLKRSLVFLLIFSVLLVGAPFIFSDNVFAYRPPDAGPGLESPFKEDLTLLDFLNKILKEIVLPIGAVVAVVALVFSGFLFVTAQGNEDKLKTAKKTFTWTVVGIAVLLGALVISEGIRNTICLIVDNVPGLGCPK